LRELKSSNVDNLLRLLLQQEALFALDLTDYTRVTLPALMTSLVGVIHWKSIRGVRESIPVRLPLDAVTRTFLAESGIGSFVSPDGENPFSLGRETIVVSRRSAPRFLVPVSIVAKKLHPYQDYEAECSRFLNRIADALEGTLATELKYSTADVRKFWSPNKEIIFNIFEHSESWGIGAIVRDAAGVVVSYADLGVGIPNTIGVANGAATRQPTADAAAIKRAFQFGVSRFQERGRGTGLNDTLRFVLEHGGALECRSGHARVRFSGQTITSVSAVRLPGTQITLLLPPVGTR
jgi:hypothetical protein